MWQSLPENASWKHSLFCYALLGCQHLTLGQLNVLGPVKPANIESCLILVLKVVSFLLVGHRFLRLPSNICWREKWRVYSPKMAPASKLFPPFHADSRFYFYTLQPCWITDRGFLSVSFGPDCRLDSIHIWDSCHFQPVPRALASAKQQMRELRAKVSKAF